MLRVCFPRLCRLSQSEVTLLTQLTLLVLPLCVSNQKNDGFMGGVTVTSTSTAAEDMLLLLSEALITCAICFHLNDGVRERKKKLPYFYIFSEMEEERSPASSNITADIKFIKHSALSLICLCLSDSVAVYVSCCLFC